MTLSMTIAHAPPPQRSPPVKMRLPHPYLTTYHLHVAPRTPPGAVRAYFLRQDDAEPEGEPFPHALHDEGILLAELEGAAADEIDEADNTAWARARRSPAWGISREGTTATPTVGQVWLLLYAFFTLHHEVETFRLRLPGGGGGDALSALLLESMVATAHPRRVPGHGVDDDGGHKASPPPPPPPELLVLRSAFWQGCASPLGNRPIWLPAGHAANTVPHLDYAVDTLPHAAGHLRHPRRRPKPPPGSLLYSRYIPSLDEHFTLAALDHTNPRHVAIFHRWQNDPRVARGWRESGTLAHHTSYLTGLAHDPHVVAVLGSFDSAPFAYFEIYWAKEDRMGMHYAAGDFDRGRHSLVGDDAFRGAHRVAAWWPSLVHYLFLDDHRTENVVGEPRLGAGADPGADKVLMYEYVFGLHQEQRIDLPHKRSSLVRCSRERFFQLCPLEQRGGRGVPGTGFSFAAAARL